VGSRTATALKTKIQKLKHLLESKMEERNQTASEVGVPILDEPMLAERNEEALSESNLLLPNCYFEFLRSKEEYLFLRSEISRVKIHCEEDAVSLRDAVVCEMYQPYEAYFQSFVRRRIDILEDLSRKLDIETEYEVYN
jgi:hypothetical protein